MYRLCERSFCDPVRNTVKPRAQALAIADRRRLPEQDQEGGLERIFDIVSLWQDPPAEVEHHGAVPRHDRFECQSVAARREPLEQQAVRHTRKCPDVEKGFDLLDGRTLHRSICPPSKPSSSGVCQEYCGDPVNWPSFFYLQCQFGNSLYLHVCHK